MEGVPSTKQLLPLNSTRPQLLVPTSWCCRSRSSSTRIPSPVSNAYRYNSIADHPSSVLFVSRHSGEATTPREVLYLPDASSPPSTSRSYPTVSFVTLCTALDRGGATFHYPLRSSILVDPEFSITKKNRGSGTDLKFTLRKRGLPNHRPWHEHPLPPQTPAAAGQPTVRRKRLPPTVRHGSHFAR